MISLTTAMAVGGVCVAFQGFFSGSEIAMVSANRARLRERAEKGDRGARLVEDFLARPQILGPALHSDQGGAPYNFSSVSYHHGLGLPPSEHHHLT